MNRLILFPILALAPLLALGHHSNAEYDRSVVTELQGEVVNVSWRNPHIRLTLRTEDADGTAPIWTLEAQDVNSLGRRGLDGSLINVGDIVRVAGNPSTLQANLMSVSNALLPDGTEISIRGNPEPRWSTEERIGFEQTTAEEALAAAGEGRGLFRVWMSDGPGGLPAQLPLTAAARAARTAWDPANDPTMQCIASGMPAAMRVSPPHPIDLTEQGDKVMLAACYTFRAAAVEQLQTWGDHLGVDVIAHRHGADPGAVAFDTVQAAKSRKLDVSIIDTAGRLHTKSNLMEELKKVQRVLANQGAAAPRVLLVLDATIGQNGLAQARAFTEAFQCDGVFLAKLDGTSKGGVVLAIVQELELPVLYIGSGEQPEDIGIFDAGEFVEGLFTSLDAS